MSLVNNGLVLANQSASLTISPNATGATNNGTFQANSGSSLIMNGTLTNYNPATSTLTGGSYNALSGMIELSQASATGSTPPDSGVRSTSACSVGSRRSTGRRSPS